MKLNKIFFVVLLTYVISRVISLTILPVFADEAIYIRWAQMMYDDPKQFTFLPLYDGKTPLFIWMLVPLVNNPHFDPLTMARLLSVMTGILLLYSIWLIAKESGGSRRAQVLSAVLVMFLPFTFFYSRMALIDTLLSALLGLSFWSFLRARNHHYQTKWLLLSGLFWGFGLMAKTSAFYYLPAVMGISIIDLWQIKKLRKLPVIASLGGALLVGLSLIGWMRISPLFPFLFQRSSDFAYSIPEITHNLPHILESNFSRIGKWLLVYLTPVFWVTLLFGFSKRARSLISPLLLGFGLFVLPFLISGKLLSSRYFLPTVIWLIPTVAIVMDLVWRNSKYVFVSICAGTLIFCLSFIVPLYDDPGSTPFTDEDVVQYLTEWSSGYGIPEIRDYLIERAQTNQVYVATEGYFGTLPDGLSIYFHHSPLQQTLEIHGIGQPVTNVSNTLFEKAATHEVYLVVNQHRLLINPPDPRMQLIGTYPRPRQGPSLLLFRVKQ